MHRKLAVWENAAFSVAEVKDSVGNRWGYLLKVIRR